jgi:uncharacterized membrane protein YukC
MIMIMMMIMISIINTVYKRIVTYSDARRKEFTISAIRSFIDDDYDDDNDDVDNYNKHGL